MKNTPKRIAKFSGQQSINCIADVEKFRYWNWVLQLIAVCIAVQFFAIILLGPLGETQSAAGN